MVPVSVLPAAGLMVALGRLIQNGSQNAVGVVTHPLWHGFGDICFRGGLAIFEQLPVIFAIGVAIGFTGGAGVAGLASVAGYFTLVNVLKVIGTARNLPLAIDTGVFGGIIIGLVSASLYKRFFKTQLHPVLGFFSGKRLVPIVTVGAAIGVGVLLGFIWPPIQAQINAIGLSAMNSNFGPALYAAGKRLLIPVGLHHVYYPSFLYQFGEFVTQSGMVLHGDSTRYFAGDPTAGRFMASEFPIMLFGLPAAAYAMYLRAPLSKRKAIGGVMLSAALTSIITGITEPIEFSFIFVAPILYIFHVLVAFLSGFLTGLFDVHLGYTFSASAIDYVLGYFNQKNSFSLFVAVAPLIALLYFGVFYWAIGFLNLKTPGRETEGESAAPVPSFGGSQRAVEILAALGGASNIKMLDACITRLRLTAFDPAKVLSSRLKELGAAGVLDAGGGNFQIVFGVESDKLKEEIQDIISTGESAVSSVSSVKPSTVQSTSHPSTARGTVSIISPLAGKVMSLEKVPDAAFAQKIMGDGLAIEPDDNSDVATVYAPFDATVAQLFRTNHAVGVVSTEGLEVLIHVGIDTVKMGGKGFKAFVTNGQKVKAGDKLIEFDKKLVAKEAKSIISPITITNMERVKKMDFLSGANSAVREQQPLIEVELTH
ncbi:MAG: PTS transporter subunit EIIC [Deltaproteobacteria bacterium]|nr:PTS transporter subunit EIIC [Deltaproteobacteria bacterium]